MAPVTHHYQHPEPEIEIPSTRTGSLLLFTRPDCHLCDLAVNLLEAEDIVFSKVNIETDNQLVERYGTRIPVLMSTDSGVELGWPFTAQALEQFMESRA